MTEKVDKYEHYYFADLQGDFYGEQYYRERDQEEESAIVYSDDEDKRLFSYIIRDFFKARKILEIGCAMGYLLKELIGFGFDAYGIDFSQYCLDRVPLAVKNRVRKADVMDMPFADNSFDMVVGLDILEHLPPSLLQKTLRSIHRVLKPGGIYLGVIPAYGENKHGPMVFDYRERESWVRDAEAGLPFREIPMDVNGKPHMGHLIHATVDWWESQFGIAGFNRLGAHEEAIHRLYDSSLDKGRWGIFLFKKRKNGIINRVLPRRVIENRTVLKRPPVQPQGLFNWEYWPDLGWARWTEMVAVDNVRRRGLFFIINFLVDHPDCSPADPVLINFSLNGESLTNFHLTQRGWRRASLRWRGDSQRGILRINVSRSFKPSEFSPSQDHRKLGIAVRPYGYKLI